MNEDLKNYNSVSPSAKVLLLSKGYTDIPFAKAAAELISQPDGYAPAPEKLDIVPAIRMLHFEYRYKSVDKLMQGLGIGNILELSSGFSFRGLDTVQSKSVHYIDTDLPDLITTKQQLIGDLQKDLTLKGKLEVLPLNALDEQQFADITSHFDDGKVLIVNEGLLMYLGMEEKKKLCAIIRNLLQKTGGYWITADVYVRMEGSFPTVKFNDDFEDFLAKHNVEDNKFENFEQAEAFFNEQGFVVDKEADQNYEEMGTMKYIIPNMTPEQLANPGKGPKVQATWRLRVG